jgi:hypothetical protein
VNQGTFGTVSNIRVIPVIRGSLSLPKQQRR